MMDADPATVKFAQALPLVLLPASSQLAALHTTRLSHYSQDHTPTPTAGACPRCGADATFQRTRIARSKQPRSSQPAARIVLTTCTACDGVSSTPYQPGHVPSFSRKRRSTAGVVAIPSSQLLAPASSSPAPVKVLPLPVSDPPLNVATKPGKPTPAAAVIPDKRRAPPPPAASNQLGVPPTKNKKKSGLQQMLERNREKEKNKSKVTETKQSSGLSAFLSTL